jgi:high-affinity iron transporter
VHTAHEGGWLNSFQEHAVNLEWLVRRGSVQSALLTGMLGIQPEPTVGEVFVWFLYAIPMTIYVLRPAKPRMKTKASPPSKPALEPAI